MKNSSVSALRRPRHLSKTTKKRGFTLLELVVALVVLGILAALAIPTYTTVIGNAKTAVATSDAISVATDAVAIASYSDVYATQAQFTTATAESSNVTAIFPADNYIDGGTGAGATSSITLAVTENGGTYDVNVTWPDQVNGAPYVTSTSGGSGGSDSTTTTALADPACVLTSLDNTSQDATFSCTGVASGSTDAVAIDAQGTHGSVVDGVRYFLDSGYLPSSFTVTCTDNVVTSGPAGSCAVPYAGSYFTGSIALISEFTSAPFTTAPQAFLSGDNGGTWSGPYTVTGSATTTTTTTTTSTTTTTTTPYVEASCSVDVTGPYANSTAINTWSLTCTGVTGAAIEVIAPVPGGVAYFYAESADRLFSATGAPYAALPSSFTINNSYVNSTDDSTPSVPMAEGSVFYSSGGAAPLPDSAIGQVLVDGTNDPCIASGTGCGTPTVTTTGF